MKHIKVDSCKHCPLKKYDELDRVWYCQHPETEGMEILDLNKVDLYCVLEDCKEEK